MKWCTKLWDKHIAKKIPQGSSTGYAFGAATTPRGRKDSKRNMKNLENQPKVQLFELFKTFTSEKGTTKALNGLSLEMYEGQILALLGHNGY